MPPNSPHSARRVLQVVADESICELLREGRHLQAYHVVVLVVSGARIVLIGEQPHRYDRGLEVVLRVAGNPGRFEHEPCISTLTSSTHMTVVVELQVDMTLRLLPRSLS